MHEFDSVLTILPTKLRQTLQAIPEAIKEDTYEIRLRRDKPLTLFGKYGSAFVGVDSGISYLTFRDALLVSSAQIAETTEKVSGYSLYAHQNDMATGFITFGSGHRVGFCGTAVTENGRVTAVRDVSSLNIRIARVVDADADGLLHKLGEWNGLLIAGAPCTGKTTLLRAVASRVSSSYEYGFAKTVILDERFEMMGADGANCDVLRGYPKEEALAHATRVLSPDVIICDEVTSEREAETIIRACYSGVRFAASVHCRSKEELLRRSVSRKLLLSGCFDRFALLRDSSHPGQVMEILKTEEWIYENSSGTDGDRKLLYRGVPDYTPGAYTL